MFTGHCCLCPAFITSLASSQRLFLWCISGIQAASFYFLQSQCLLSFIAPQNILVRLCSVLPFGVPSASSRPLRRGAFEVLLKERGIRVRILRIGRNLTRKSNKLDRMVWPKECRWRHTGCSVWEWWDAVEVGCWHAVLVGTLAKIEEGSKGHELYSGYLVMCSVM